MTTIFAIEGIDPVTKQDYCLIFADGLLQEYTLDSKLSNPEVITHLSNEKTKLFQNIQSNFLFGYSGADHNSQAILQEIQHKNIPKRKVKKQIDELNKEHAQKNVHDHIYFLSINQNLQTRINLPKYTYTKIQKLKDKTNLEQLELVKRFPAIGSGGPTASKKAMQLFNYDKRVIATLEQAIQTGFEIMKYTAKNDSDTGGLASMGLMINSKMFYFPQTIYLDESEKRVKELPIEKIIQQTNYANHKQIKKYFFI